MVKYNNLMIEDLIFPCLKSIRRIILGVFIFLQPIASTYAQQDLRDKNKIDSDILMEQVRMMAEELIRTGFTAGDHYGEVWIRDFNTFMEVACKVNDHQIIKKHLLTFLKFQQPDGQIIDGFVPVKKSDVGYKYIYSTLAPEYAGHKNTVETDQETSLIQAVYRYITYTGDSTILNERVGSLTVQKRLQMALGYLFENKFDKKFGLIWGATTADWGDIQPENKWGVELDSTSHKAIDIYDNAMLVVAINNYIAISSPSESIRNYWEKTNYELKKNINKYLWDKKNCKFKPHIYLDGSPFPKSFDENKIYYHGGTAVAIEAGILSSKQVRNAYVRMKQNVEASGAPTIGLTLYPVYPVGFFKNRGMDPYSYQNGGDWTWFGARMVRQLIRYGFFKEAKEALRPMLERVVNNKGFYEWYSRDNKPKGSSNFRGEAGVLWAAILDLKIYEKK